MTRLVVMIITLLALAACAPADPGTLPTLAPTISPDAVPTQETLDGEGEAPSDDLNLGEGGAGLFTATLSGALDQTLAGSGSFGCEANMHVLGVTSGADMLTFTMPPDTATGEFTIEGDQSAIVSALEVGGTAYDGDVFGIITLEATPTAAGEAVSGSFDMNYIAGDNTVNAVGTFDLLADGVCG